MKKLRVVFFGTSSYSLPVVAALAQHCELLLIVTRPDKPEGRKAIMTASATKRWAIEHNIDTLTPETLKKETPPRRKLEDKLKKLKVDLAIVADYGLIIPEGIFSLPRLGTINIHFSRLPTWRGPSPVQFTLLSGETDAWITIFKLDNHADIPIKMDSGPIIWQKSYPILPDDTTGQLYTRLFEHIAAELPTILSTPFSLTPQDHTKATYCRFLTREDGFVPYDQIAKSENYNRFRAMTPWPGLWTLTPEGKRLKILGCHSQGEKLILDEIQYEGKKPQRPKV